MSHRAINSKGVGSLFCFFVAGTSRVLCGTSALHDIGSRCPAYNANFPLQIHGLLAVGTFRSFLEGADEGLSSEVDLARYQELRRQVK